MFLDIFYPAWSLDQRTQFMVELMFRSEDDMDGLYDIFKRQLAVLNEKEGVTS